MIEIISGRHLHKCGTKWNVLMQDETNFKCDQLTYHNEFGPRTL